MAHTGGGIERLFYSREGRKAGRKWILLTESMIRIIGATNFKKTLVKFFTIWQVFPASGARTDKNTEGPRVSRCGCLCKKCDRLRQFWRCWLLRFCPWPALRLRLPRPRRTLQWLMPQRGLPTGKKV